MTNRVEDRGRDRGLDREMNRDTSSQGDKGGEIAIVKVQYLGNDRKKCRGKLDIKHSDKTRDRDKYMTLQGQKHERDKKVGKRTRH